MLGWFRRKPRPAPAAPVERPPVVPVAITATATARGGGRLGQKNAAQFVGPSAEQVLVDAVNEAHKAGEGNDAKKMAAWLATARATRKAALAQMEATGKPVPFSVGTIKYVMAPPP